MKCLRLEIRAPIDRIGALLASNGGAEGIRTPDLFRAREALSQLSHCPPPIQIIASWRAKVNTCILLNRGLRGRENHGNTEVLGAGCWGGNPAPSTQHQIPSPSSELPQPLRRILISWNAKESPPGSLTAGNVLKYTVVLGRRVWTLPFLRAIQRLTNAGDSPAKS